MHHCCDYYFKNKKSHFTSFEPPFLHPMTSIAVHCTISKYCRLSLQLDQIFHFLSSFMWSITQLVKYSMHVINQLLVACAKLMNKVILCQSLSPTLVIIIAH